MTVEALRMIERMLVAGGGVLSIWLGFLLFRAADLRQDSKGEFKSALFNVSLTKVGPGVFFALFGAYILATDVKAPINIDNYVTGVGILSDDDAIKQLTTEVSKLPDNPQKQRIQEALNKLSAPTTSQRMRYIGKVDPDSLPDDVKLRMLMNKGVNG